MLRGSALPAGWPSAAILFTATCAVGIGPAMAAIDLSAGASVGGEYNSNPIELSKEQELAFEASGFSVGDDTARRLTANVAADSGVNNPLYLGLHALYTRMDYVNIDSLDHTEYDIGGKLDWKPGQLYDVSLEASQIRVPIGLNDVGGTRTVQQTSTMAFGTLRVRPTPNWQLGLTPSWYQNKLPLNGADDFELTESSGALQLDYLGAGKLVPGLVVKESRGKYSQVENATRYKQQSAGIALNYKVMDFSSFSLFAGYTRRTTHLLEPTDEPLALGLEGTKSGFTGRLSYQRQLSVKTGINVNVFREFQQYDVGVNTTVGTGFDGGLTWKPTAKLSATVGGGAVWMTINGLQIARTTDERKDLERRFSLSLEYFATQRISLRTYATRRLHNSTIRTGVFNQTIAGLELSAAFD